jgi:polyisoprenoid-binding protein YceI
MKTLIFSLLMLFHTWSGKPVISSAPIGGISVLAVNTTSSTVGWQAEKPTGTHTGTMRILSGDLVMHCGQLYSANIKLDMSSLAVSDLSSPEKEKLETNLRGNNFFDTGKFPGAQLEITSVNHNSEKAFHFVTILANLTMHGITKQITFTADVSKSTINDFAGQASIVINRRDWKIATNNIKYDTFIYKSIRLHVQLRASRVDTELTRL